MTFLRDVRIAAVLFVCYSVTAFSQSVYLQEGFNGSGIPPGWTVSQVSGNTAVWSVVGTGTNPPIAPFGGTGQAKFNSYDANPGDQSRLTSSRVDLSAAADPFLTFYMYHDDEFLSSLDSVYVEASTTDSATGPWTMLGGFQRPGANPGWEQHIVSLDQYEGSSRLFIGFRGVSEYGNNIYIDEVRIADSSFHDIGLVSLVPLSTMSDDKCTSVAAGSRFHYQGKDRAFDGSWQNTALTVLPFAMPVDINGVIQNFGTFSEPSYQIQWEVDTEIQNPVNNARTLPRDQRDTLLLSWLTPTPGTHTVTAWTAAVGDSNRSNDSARVTIAVLDSSVIFAEMFNGPVFPPPGWITVNRDSSMLPPWFLGTSTSKFVPYEGTGFAADNFQRANGTYIDDYLISPAIPGIAQPGFVDSLKFWARSALNSPPAANFPDSLMILLSTTGTDTSNFTIFLDYFSVPKTGWTLKTYPLTGRIPPNSNVHIAFRYLHYFGGPSGDNSDFVGVDFVHIKRGLPTSVTILPSSPHTFTLAQNYPNPFNPSTTIRFELAEQSAVQLAVYNIFGQQICSLVNAHRGPGTFSVVWDGRNSAGVDAASGVYLYRLTTNASNGTRTYSSVGRMLLLR